MKLKLFSGLVLSLLVLVFGPILFRKTPKTAKEYFERGKKHVKASEVFEAKDDFDMAIKFNPNFAEAFRNIGKIKEAEADEKRAAEIGEPR